MAKDSEKRLAYNWYVHFGKTAKEISQLVGVSEPTMVKWVKVGEWKKEREARSASPTKRLENIKAITGNLAEERIALSKKLSKAEKEGNTSEVETIRKATCGIDDAISKWNKHLQQIDKENAITLSVYLEVMDSIFNAMQHHDSALFMKTISFQEAHVNNISIKLG